MKKYAGEKDLLHIRRMDQPSLLFPLVMLNGVSNRISEVPHNDVISDGNTYM